MRELCWFVDNQNRSYLTKSVRGEANPFVVSLSNHSARLSQTL